MIEDCVDNIVEEITESRISEAEEFPILTTTPLQDLSLAIAPNPVSGTATLTYVLPESEKVNLSLYSLNGELVHQLLSGMQASGINLVEWPVGDLPPGM